MKPAPKSSNWPAELRHLRGMYPTLDHMIENKRPLTRESYLTHAYGEVPVHLSGEEEAELPPPFRKVPDTSGPDGPESERVDRKSEDGPFRFEGSLIDGPDLDLPDAAGVSLTDEEQDRLWEMTNADELLGQCDCVVRIEVGRDDRPGQSDIFYRYEVSDRQVLAGQLRAAIQNVLNEDR